MSQQTHVQSTVQPMLILIHGLKESGKSTTADHLCEQYGYQRVKMADPLKNMLRSLLRDATVPNDMVEYYLEGAGKNVPIPQVSNRTARQLMQTLGDEWRRMQCEDFWVDIIDSKISSLFREGKHVVIDDIRYLNEYSRYSKYRPMKIVTTRGSKHFEPIREDQHPSERPLPLSMFDFHLSNDYDTKDLLWGDIDQIMTAWSQATLLFEKTGRSPKTNITFDAAA